MTIIQTNSAVALAALLLSTANAAHAVTVTATDVYARTSVTGTAGNDGSSQQGLPVAVSNAAIGDGTGDTDAIEASAYQHENGVSYVRAFASDPYGMGYSGDGTEENGEAWTAITYTFFNDGPDTIAPIFNFTLSDIIVSAFTAGGAAPNASIVFGVSSIAETYSARVEVQGDYNHPKITTDNIDGVSSQSECGGSTCYRTTWTGSASGSISVGAIASGESGYASVTMFANATFEGYEDGAYAQIWDPNGGPVFTYSVTDDVPVSPVPLPASGLLLLGALSLVGLRRRS